MPFISLVVPVYQVEAYVSECLDSILGQSFADYELIAVDDRTRDSSADVIDEYAARDERVRAVHLDSHVGLGPARNAGLELARGEYTWFLDSDDRLAPEALGAVAERLRDLKPDVLVVDYAREYTGGRTKPSRCGEMLARSPETFTIDGYPELLSGFCVAWNKVVRTEFLARSELRFPSGWYEDIPVTYPLLAAAERISTLALTCVLYRQRRHGSILGTVSPAHADLVGQYELALSRLEPGPVREFVQREAVKHGKQLLGIGGRLPASQRRRYFERFSAFAKEHGTYGRGLRDLMLRKGFWPGYQALALGRAVARRVRQRVRRSVRYLRRGLPQVRLSHLKRLPKNGYYWWQRRMPLQDLAVYSSYWGRAYECNPAAIHAAAKRLAPGVKSVWVVKRDEISRLPQGVTPVVAGSLAYYRALARAKWLFNNANFEDEIVKRRGSVHVQTHHGTPLKLMGVDEPVFRADPEKLLKRCDRWDFSLVSNRYSRRVWSRAYPCGFEFLEYGYPRNDVLVNATPGLIGELRSSYPDGLLVLYAPTHRGSDEPPGPVSIPGATVLAKSHYLVPGGGRGPSIEELMLVADVLVTDYSSVMFDYALLDRPIVIFAPDWDRYVRERGVYFDLLSQPPGVVTSSEDELREAFSSGAVWETSAARAAFRARFCEFDDGRAAERVVRRVMLGELV